MTEIMFCYTYLCDRHRKQLCVFHMFFVHTLGFCVCFYFMYNYLVILLVCVCVLFLFLTSVSCLINIKNLVQSQIRILRAAVRLRNVILWVIQASHLACHPGVGMHADEFFSTALEEASARAALVHHKGVLAPKLFHTGFQWLLV